MFALGDDCDVDQLSGRGRVVGSCPSYDGDVVVQFANYDQGLPFYLKQRIVLVKYLGALEFGALQENDPSWFIDGKGLAELWTGDRRVILVVNSDHKEYVAQQTGLSLPEPLAETAKRLVFVNRKE